MTMHRVATVIVAGAAACYAPRFGECELACSPDVGCPSGFTCDDVTHLCRSGAACPDITSCWTDAGGMTPTNFHPCRYDWPPSIGTWTLSSPTFVCTDPNDLAPCLGLRPGVGGLYDSGGGNLVWLIHATDVAIASTLLVRGAIPLLVVVDDAVALPAGFTINGQDASGGSPPICTNTAGSTSPDGLTASGGGGGGNDGAGGRGGNDGSGLAAGGTAGSPIGSPSQSPIFAGCAGASGGSTATTMGGQGGNGGAGIEIVSRVSISVAGLITVGGAAGHGGPTITNHVGGGGGGGAGGSILLEAPMIAFASTAQVCADGGSGGQGGGAIGVAAAGVDGGCAPGSGMPSGSGGAGGNGAGTSGTAGDDGLAPTGANAGGGGGGATGRIRFHATTVKAGGIIAPTPVVDHN